jgi:hypothetical protein
MPHDINSQQSFDALPLKPNGQRKNLGAHDRIPPDPAISGHKSPSGVHRQSLPEHTTATGSMKNMQQTDLRLGVREILGRTPPLFDRPTNSDGREGHHHHARDCNPRLPRDAGRTRSPCESTGEDESNAAGIKGPWPDQAHLNPDRAHGNPILAFTKSPTAAGREARPGGRERRPAFDPPSQPWTSDRSRPASPSTTGWIGRRRHSTSRDAWDLRRCPNFARQRSRRRVGESGAEASCGWPAGSPRCGAGAAARGSGVKADGARHYV